MPYSTVNYPLFLWCIVKTLIEITQFPINLCQSFVQSFIYTLIPLPDNRDYSAFLFSEAADQALT
jgi:hypothetical protein